MSSNQPSNITTIQSSTNFTMNHMPVALHESMCEIKRISSLVAGDLTKALLDTEHLDNSEVISIRNEIIATLAVLAERFRGIRLICTRLGLTTKYGEGSVNNYTKFTERFAVLEEFSITYCTDTGVMSIVMLIEKNEDFGQYYSVDAINAAEGTILFPNKTIVQKIYDKLDTLTTKLEKISDLAKAPITSTVVKRIK